MTTTGQKVTVRNRTVLLQDKHVHYECIRETSVLENVPFWKNIFIWEIFLTRMCIYYNYVLRMSIYVTVCSCL